MRFLAIRAMLRWRPSPPPAAPLVADEMELQTNSVGTVRVVERNVLQVPTKHDRFGRPPLLMFLPRPVPPPTSRAFLFCTLPSPLGPTMREYVVCGAIGRTGTFSVYVHVTRESICIHTAEIRAAEDYFDATPRETR